MFITTQSAAPASFLTFSGTTRWLPIFLLIFWLGSSETWAQAYCPALYPTNSPAAAQGIVDADFNGDGKPDLVTAHYNETNGSPNAVSMLLNNGSGGFATGILYAVGGRPVSMAVGDFNGDGKPDLVTANGRANSTISVLMNNGSGGFLPKMDYAPMIYNTRVAVGDFNNDGKPDIVVMGSGGAGIMVLLNNGSGGFSTGIFKQLGMSNANLNLTVGDFDKDGRLDVAAGVSYTNNQGVAVNQVQVLKGNGGGDFSIFSSLAYGVGGLAVSLAVGDVNGDGNLDLATVNAGVVSVQLGSTNNYFGPKTDFAVGANPSIVLVKDFNKDGKLDLVVANASGQSVSVLLGNGAGSFGAKTDIPLEIQIGGTSTQISPVGLVVTDFNGDGKPDLATARSGASQAFVMLNCPVSPLQAVISESTLNVCPGQVVNLSATVHGGLPPYTYEWGLVAGATFIGATNEPTASATIFDVRFANYRTFSVTVRDAAGQASTFASKAIYVYAPTNATITATPSATLSCTQPSLTLSVQYGYSYSFSGPGIVSTSGNTAVVNQPGIYSVTATSLLGGCVASSQITVDGTASLVTNVSGITRYSPSIQLTNVSTVTYEVVFSSPVTGVDGADFSLTSTGTTTGSVGTVSGSGTTYTVDINGITGTGTLRLDLNGTGTGIKNECNNDIQGGYTGGQTYEFDFSAPFVASITRKTPLAEQTNVNSVIYTVTFSESVTGVDATDFSLTATNSVSGTISTVTGSGTTYDVQVNGIGGDGTLRLDVKASGTSIIDGAANDLSGGFATGQTYTFDHTAPSVVSINRQDPLDAATTAATLTYRVTFSEAVTGVGTGDFALTATIPSAGNIASIAVISTSVYDVTVNVTNAGGGTLRLDLNSSATGVADLVSNPINSGFTSGQIYTLGIPPSITGCPATAQTFNPGQGLCYATIMKTTLLTGLTIDGAPIPTVTVWVGTTEVTASYNFPVGNTTVTVKAANGIGTDATCSFIVTVSDNQDPSITAPAAITAQPADAGTCGAAKANVNLGTPTTSDNCGVQGTNNNAPATFPVGTTIVTWTVTDVNGRTSTATQSVTVIDNQNPSITAPAAITAQPADAGMCGAAKANVNLGTPTTSDNCGVQSVTNNAPATFLVGTTIVTWTVTDVNGRTNTATQSVTVVDNQDPSITAPASITAQPADANTCGAAKANVNLGTPRTSDNCGVQGTTNNAPATFPVGITIVTWTVTDVNGRTTTATQSVTVVDNQDPSITAPAFISAQPADAGACGAAKANVNLGTPITSDNCGVQNTTNNAPAIFPVGTTIVTWTVTDVNGRTKTATQSVTVIDNQDPSITAPNAITAQPADANTCSAAKANVNLGTPTTSDNCGVQSTTNNAPVIFPVGTTIVTWKVTDVNGRTNTATQNVTVVDHQKPSITAISATPATLWPPDRKMRDVTINYTITDNCTSPIRTTLSVSSNEAITGTGDGDIGPDWEVISPTQVKLRAERGKGKEARVYTIYITATDASGNSKLDSVKVYVAHNISAPITGTPFKVGSTVNLAGAFWDISGNKHTAKWLIDDNATATGTVTEPLGTKNGSVTGSYKFTSAGIYKLQMDVTDQNKITAACNTNEDLESIVVIYDPNGGYGYGGGWYNSQKGALKANAEASGKVSYGFNVSYFKGASNPKGETQFEFKQGNLEFNALNYDYLSVSGYKAQIKGSGRIIGDQSGYNFILTVIDGDVSGGGGVDKIRMKIFNKNTGAVIYDNLPGASDAADPTVSVGVSSNITITGGNVSTSSSSAPLTLAIPTYIQKTDAPEKLQVRALPNPSRNFFTVVLQSGRTEQVILRVVDVLGRVVEVRNGITANGTLRIGDNYRPGIYFAEVIQGKEKVGMKLVKQSE